MLTVLSQKCEGDRPSPTAPPSLEVMLYLQAFDLLCVLYRVATSSCRGHVDELADFSVAAPRAWNRLQSDGAETAAIDGLVSSWSENILVSFCLRSSSSGRNTSASVTVTVTVCLSVAILRKTWFFLQILNKKYANKLRKSPAHGCVSVVRLHRWSIDTVRRRDVACAKSQLITCNCAVLCESSFSLFENTLKHQVPTGLIREAVIYITLHQKTIYSGLSKSNFNDHYTPLYLF